MDISRRRSGRRAGSGMLHLRTEEGFRFYREYLSRCVKLALPAALDAEGSPL